MKVIILLLFITFFPNQLIKTQLHVTVRNELGNTVADAHVTLYATEIDFEKSQNPVQDGKTDEKGIVRFKELLSQEYFVLVEKNDANNMGGGEKTGSLVANRINKVTIIIQE